MTTLRKAIKKAKHKHSIKVNGKLINLSNSSLPHEGRVTLSLPVVEERGPNTEIKVYAICDNDTYEPGCKYVCYFNMKGKGIGFFSVSP